MVRGIKANSGQRKPVSGERTAERGRLLAVSCLWLVAGWWLLAGCGRMPPEPYWQPDAADSSAIDSVVRANAASLRTGFAEPALTFLAWGVPDSVTRKAIKDNPFRQHYICDSLQHIFFSDSYQLRFSFIATLDTFHDSVLHGTEWVDTTWIETTATVTAVETIPGELLLHVEKFTKFLRDTFFEPAPGETLWLPYYDSLWTDDTMPVDTFKVAKPLSAVVTGGCALRKESGAWRLWKLSGGLRFSAPTPEDAPYLAALYITNGTRVDTVTPRPDTLHFGIQRLYSPEELPTFTVGESLWVQSALTLATEAQNFAFFDGQRYQLTRSSVSGYLVSFQPNKIPLTRPGLFRLYFEQIPFEVLYEAGGSLTAVVWGMPIRVIGGAQ